LSNLRCLMFVERSLVFNLKLIIFNKKSPLKIKTDVLIFRGDF
jgi:hypothetical protein